MMTVHKSKGLEFKVVIFAGIGGFDQKDKQAIVFEYEGDLVASEHKGINKILEQDRSDKEDAEKKRLMYVALTRAKDHLILIGGYKINQDGTISSGDILKWYVDAVGADLQSRSCSNSDVVIEDVTDTPRKAGLHDVSKQLPQDVEFPQFVVKETRLSVTQLERDSGVPFDAARETVVLPASDVDDLILKYGIQDAFGTLCHLVLEYTVSKGNSNDAECNICERTEDNVRLLSQARKFASDFIASNLYSKLIQGNETREEVRFYTVLDDLPDVAVEGVIDLLVLGENVNLVVDYKTDSIRDPDRHKTQVQTYVKVAEQIFQKPCLGTLFYLRDASTGPVWDREGRCVELPSSL